MLGLYKDDLRSTATELWQTIVRLETEKYDLQERQKRQDYDVSTGCFSENDILWQHLTETYLIFSYITQRHKKSLLQNINLPETPCRRCRQHLSYNKQHAAQRAQRTPTAAKQTKSNKTWS